MEKNLPHSNRSFDDDIKSKLQDYEVTPSPHIWGKIEAELHPEASRPKGIFWLQNKMLLSAVGVLLLVGFSSTGARFLIKNIMNEYQIDKVNNKILPESNFQLINNINKNNKNKEKTQVLSSENNSAIDKVANYLEEILPSANRQANASESSNVATNKTGSYANASNLSKNTLSELSSNTNINTSSNLFSLIKMNLQNLEFNTTSNSLSQTFQPENEIEFKREPYNLKGVYIGPEFGTSLVLNSGKRQNSNPKMGNQIHYSPGLAAQAGLVLGYNFNNRVGIETRISYANQTQKFESIKYDAKSTGKINLTYIEVPLNVNYKFNQLSKKSNRVSSINLTGGLQYAYLAQAKLMMTSKLSKKGANITQDAHNDISNHQIGANIGVDYDLFIAKNLYWTVGIDGILMTDVTSKNGKSAPTLAFGVRTGIRFFSGGK